MTTKQRIVQYMREYLAFYGYNPTYREIADGLQISLGTLHGHVSRMKRMGILRGDKKRRSLQVLERR